MVATRTSALDERWVLVLLQFVFGAYLPCAAIEVFELLEDGFFDKLLLEDVTGALVFAFRLEV